MTDFRLQNPVALEEYLGKVILRKKNKNQYIFSACIYIYLYLFLLEWEN